MSKVSEILDFIKTLNPEAGKGVDCQGDTIRLEKINGYYSSTARN